MLALLLLATGALAQDAEPAPESEAPSVEVTLGLPIIAGELSIEAVFAAFAPLVPDLAYCYSKGDAADVDGEVLIRVDITDTGTVDDSAVSATTLLVPSIEWCAARVMGEAAFRTDTGATAVLPISFYPT